jgi:phosphotriesterase-related protein
MTYDHKPGNGYFAGKIMTVTGAIDPADMGLALPHEHVMSTFGAESARYPPYDKAALLGSVLPYLEKLRGYGCRTLVDCTATHFGRHPELLRQISRLSGLYILTNTGYYGAADDKYVPPHAYGENADQIAGRWTREWQYSIDDTGVRPGFIKTAVDAGPLSDIDRKLIVAAARTSLSTGLTIQTHVGDNWDAVQEILSILGEEGLDPAAWVWTHANHMPDVGRLAQAAAQGAWIALDGINATAAPGILDVIAEMKVRGRLTNLLLSHDGDSYFGDGEFRPYHYLFTDFIRALEQRGFNKTEIQQLTVDNPRRAFTIRAHPAHAG